MRSSSVHLNLCVAWQVLHALLEADMLPCLVYLCTTASAIGALPDWWPADRVWTSR